MGSSHTSQITGYRYYLGCHMGIGRGPVDEIVEITAGNREIWPIAQAADNSLAVAINPTYTFNTYNDLITAGTELITGLTIQAEVINDPDEGRNGVYQRIAAPPYWQVLYQGDADIAFNTLAELDGAESEIPYNSLTATYAQVLDDPNPANNGVYQRTSDGWQFLHSGVTGVTSSQTIQINAPNVFGGDTSEGGIQGPLEVLMGEATQVAPANMANLLGGLVPGFRGVATVFFNGLICSNNPYPKAWKFRVRRATKGWDGDMPWYPQKARIILLNGQIQGMNPAHVIYQCATDRAWGRGLPVSRLDLTSFTAAADTLYGEDFALCMKWDRSDKLSNFVANVINHIGAALYNDRGTGLMTLKLIRDDYDSTQIPHFGYGTGLLDVSEDTSGSADQATNEIVVTYHDPRDDTDRTVRAQDLASRMSSGCVYSVPVTYAGIPTDDLATRVAQRDLRVQSSLLKRYTLKLDRRAYAISPGDVVAITAADRGLNFIVLRIGKVSPGKITDGAIEAVAVQDIFGLPSTSFVGVQGTLWQPPVTGALVPTTRRLFEASYRSLVERLSAADLASVPDDSDYILAMAVKPISTALGFAIASAATGETYQVRSSSDWSPGGILSATIGLYDTTLVLTSPVDISRVSDNTTALVDNEIIEVISIAADGVTVTIARGCDDTLPAAHSLGVNVWFFDPQSNTDGRSYVVGETVGVQMLTFMSSEQLEIGSVPIDSITMLQRHVRPYPPGNLQINGVPYGNALVQAGDISFTWAHRDRLTQADQIVDTTAASIGPETGVAYTLVVYDDDSNAVRTQLGITDAGFDYSVALQTTDGILTETITISITAVVNGLTSWQSYNFTITRQ